MVRYGTVLCLATIAIVLVTTYGAPLNTATPTTTPDEHLRQRFGILTDMTHKEQHAANMDYCNNTHHNLVGFQVDHLTKYDERCATFSELHAMFANLRPTTQLVETEQGVSKTEFKKLYADLDYWQHVMQSIVKTGTSHLHKHCVVEDSSSNDPCLSITCGVIEQAEQKLYCEMHTAVAPLLGNLMYILKRDLGMNDWTSPSYDALNPPNADMDKTTVRLFSVIISHFITEEFEVAKNAGPKYYQD